MFLFKSMVLYTIDTVFMNIFMFLYVYNNFCVGSEDKRLMVQFKNNITQNNVLH